MQWRCNGPVRSQRAGVSARLHSRRVPPHGGTRNSPGTHQSRAELRQPVLRRQGGTAIAISLVSAQAVVAPSSRRK